MACKACDVVLDLAQDGANARGETRGCRIAGSRQIDGCVSVSREGKRARAPSAKYPHSQVMQRKLATKRGRARYRKRNGPFEPVFGWVKRMLGFRAFSVRGLRKVEGEWRLVCLALNLRRMSARGVAL